MHARFPLAALVVAVAAAWSPAAPDTEEQLKEKALKLNTLTTVNATQTKLTEILKDKPAAKKLVAAAAGMQAAAKDGDPPFKYYAALLLGKVAQNVKDYEAAEAFYQFCKASGEKLESGPQMAYAYDGLIDLYTDQKKWQAVEDLCVDLLDKQAKGREFANSQNGAFVRMIQAKARRGNHDEALKMVNRAADGDKKGWAALNLKAFVLREAGRYEDVLDTYKEMVKRMEKDKDLEADEKKQLIRNVRYMSTNIHVELKQIDKAAKILEELIEEESDAATYYNDLGFIWADHDMKMEESEKLIRKALELDEKARKKLLDEKKIDEETAKKQNAAYLDSLGWVLYKNKKYDEAEKYLLASIKDDEEGAHMEIWDHLADVYLAQGKTKQAVETWGKALKFEDVSKRDAERRTKITEKLKKAKADGKKGE